MKFKFSSGELNYLDRVLKSLTAMVTRDDIEAGLYRVMMKMKYKFNKYALDVFLSQKERAFLAKLLESRLQHLEHVKAMSSEAQVAGSILRKVWAG